MTIAFDAGSKSFSASDPHTVAHTGGASVQGVFAFIISPNATTDVVVGVTYDGDALTRIRTNVDTVDEVGRSYIYFLGSGVSGGAQTLSVDKTAAVATWANCVTITAARDVEVIVDEGIDEDVDDPQVTLAFGGREAMSFGVLYSGMESVSNIQDLAGQTRMASQQFAPSSLGIASRLTNVQTADDTFGWNTDITEDVALSALAISEVPTITVDAVSEDVSQDQIHTYTHNGGADVAGVLILIVHAQTAIDTVDEVTYGGDICTRVRTNSDSSGDAGRTYIYFKGSGAKSGDQTVSCDRGSFNVWTHMVTITLNAIDVATQVIDDEGLDGDRANPQVTLAFGGVECMSFCACYSGLPSPADLTDLADQTRVHDHDFGGTSSVVSRLTAVQTADDVIGYTAGSQDCAFSAIAISVVSTALALQTVIGSGIIPFFG